MSLAKAYLALYNLALIAGWSLVLALGASALRTGGPSTVYAAVEFPLTIAQTAAVLEIAHAALGIARSPVLVTAMQVSSRLMVVWGVLKLAPASRTASLEVFGPLSIGVPSLILAWGVTEVVRYSFYFFKVVRDDVPRVITWCRYTLFIVLYPLGVSSELFLAYSGFGYLVKTNPYAYAMPNKLNFAFHLPTFMVMFFAGYVPGFPMLYSYMLSQRKKVLGSRKSKRD